MKPITIICDADDSEGHRCGSAAIVQRIDYHYGALSVEDGRSVYRHVLRETVRRVICPKCGPRAQLEKVESN